MESPLAVYNELLKKYGINEDIEPSKIALLSYTETQKEEIKHTITRSLVDALHATRLQQSENEVLKAKGNNNYAQHVNELQQLVDAVKMLDTIAAELKATYPELKGE